MNLDDFAQMLVILQEDYPLSAQESQAAKWLAAFVEKKQQEAMLKRRSQAEKALKLLLLRNHVTAAEVISALKDCGVEVVQGVTVVQPKPTPARRWWEFWK